MLDKIYYINSRGTVIDFTKPPFVANETELRNYKWNIEEINNKITGFNKIGVTEKQLPIIMVGTSEIFNELLDNLEIDVLTKKPGKLFINDYYLNCYINASDVSGYAGRHDMTKILTVVTDYGMWMKEETKLFVAGELLGGFDYPIDYPFDYGNSISIDKLENPSIVPCDFEIQIAGVTTNPQIIIGDNSYSVITEVLDNEYLTINSKTKKITRNEANRNIVNEFNNRDRTNYIFEKIKPGVNTVFFDGINRFTVKLFLERSEPIWI